MWKINGVWCCSDYKTRPITFDGTNIIINWSYNELKLEFFGDENSIESILEFYTNSLKYGEWGEELDKPIIWMKIETKYDSFKSKKCINEEKIRKFINKNFFKITIFFETTIQGSPFEKDYLTSNSYWISCIGGLYYIADLYLYIEKDDIVVEGELYNNNKSPFEVKDYRQEDLYEYSLETAETAKELFKYSKKWEIFKFNS